MKHPEDEKLIMYLLGDGDDRVAIHPHVESCDHCGARLARLRSVLAAAASPVPEPDAGLEGRIWERQRETLRADGLIPDPGREERAAPAGLTAVIRPDFWNIRRIGWTAALAASVLVAFLAGLYTPTPGTEIVAADDPTGKDRILLVAVGDHLERTRMVLLEITNAESAADLGPQRVSAEALIGNNRLYRQSAQLSGKIAVADLLDEVERVLLEVAQAPQGDGQEELEWLRQRIADRDLLFKTRVIEGTARDAATPRAGGRSL